MTTKTIKVTTCDVCGRQLSKVDRYESSGSGRLVFTSNCGGAGGGCSNKIEFEDVCVECVNELVVALDEVKRKMKNKSDAIPPHILKQLKGNNDEIF